MLIYSFPIDECDWDYFEPGSGSGTRTATAVLSWNSPFSSPRVYRRNVVDSPLGSPIVYRRCVRKYFTLLILTIRTEEKIIVV